MKSTDHLFLAKNSEEKHIGYLYGSPYLGNFVVWIDSMAVLPDFRRRGIGTQLLTNIVQHFSSARWLGCATPNPVTVFVVYKVVKGTVYVGASRRMIKAIKPFCPDLSGAEFNAKKLLVRTGFQPKHSGDSREWSPPEPTEPPPWWSSLLLRLFLS